ncbi:MAG: hypothetical protein H6926_03450 [Chromatiales bacterium]|nr:hypothetical protein [Chromatiales bacterium]
MAGLKEALAGFGGRIVIPAPTPPLMLAKAEREIGILLSQYEPRQPSRYDLDETYAVLDRAHRDESGFSGVPLKFLKRAPWLMFEPYTSGAVPLLDVSGFLQAYLNELMVRAKASAVMVLATVFLRYYPVGKSYFEPLRQGIVALLRRVDGLKVKALRERSEVYGLFRVDGHREFGAQLSEAPDPAMLLVAAGLDGALAESGFVEAAAKEMLRGIEWELNSARIDASRIEAIWRFLVNSPSSGGQLRFDSLRVPLAETFLRPYGERSGSEEEIAPIREYLLRYYDDPRMHRGKWYGVDETALNVMMRWLVHSTLADFFRVVREGSGLNPDAARMWKYREAFWTAYLKQGVISDAWVILGDRVAWASRQFLSEHANGYGSFGTGGGVQALHAALIMRVGDLLITEWNHSGKYRAWFVDNPDAPKLYRRYYTRDQLVESPDFDGTHHGAEAGNWQAKLNSKIAQWTGIRIGYREYMPGGNW